MEISFKGKDCDVEIFAVTAKTKKSPELESAIKRNAFSGKVGSAYLIGNTLYVGLGNKATSMEDIRRSLGCAFNILKANKFRNAKVNLKSFNYSPKDTARAITESLILASYTFTGYQSKPDTFKFSEINFDVDSAAVKAGAEMGKAFSEGQQLAMDLANTPCNVLYPESYAKICEDFAKKNKIKCQILNEAALHKENMNCLLAVGQGSTKKPYLIVLDYNPKGAKKTIALVGKGITFDTGGISIKPAGGMELMKKDMTGSSCVLGALQSAIKLKSKNRIIVIIATAENMPDGNAINPGSVIKSRKGLQIEIVNTDAEGRLVLCDALDYAHKFEPDAIIDVATLTGASIIALGPMRSALMSNNEKLAKDLYQAGEVTGERVWRLPLDEDYKVLMKSDIADMKNSGDRKAGTIYGGKFLEAFIDPKTAWAHLDIACTSWDVSHITYLPRAGSSGITARLLAEYCLK